MIDRRRWWTFKSSGCKFYGLLFGRRGFMTDREKKLLAIAYYGCLKRKKMDVRIRDALNLFRGSYVKYRKS